MILYQLAKWMEERSRLHKKIRDAGGDNSLLQRRKDQVEQELLMKANEWMEGRLDLGDIPEPHMLEAGEAEHEFAL